MTARVSASDNILSCSFFLSPPLDFHTYIHAHAGAPVREDTQMLCRCCWMTRGWIPPHTTTTRSFGESLFVGLFAPLYFQYACMVVLRRKLTKVTFIPLIYPYLLLSPSHKACAILIFLHLAVHVCTAGFRLSGACWGIKSLSMIRHRSITKVLAHTPHHMSHTARHMPVATSPLTSHV